MEKKLYRSTKNKVLGGVCGGLGEYFAIDPVIIRIFLVLAFFPFFPITIPFLPIIYIILWIVLPADTAVVKEITEGPAQGKRSAPSFIFSLIIAFFLIFLGFALLFPDYIFRFMDILAFLVAFFLIFISVRLIINITVNKNLSLFQAAVSFICLSYGIFIILNRLNLIGEGVFIEYSKNLAAGILIAFGISLAFKNMKNKWPALIICSCIFLFVGIFSYINGNYSPAGFMGRMVNRIIPGFRHFSWKGWRQGESFSKSIPLPESVRLINCSINNSMGSLKLEDTEDLIQFDGSGISPQYSTILSKGVLNLSFDNQASETVLKINRDKPMNLSLNVSAGSVDGTLKNINMEELRISVNGGSVKLEAGEKLKRMIIENNLGDTEIRLPRNARIKIRADASLGSFKIPDEFKLSGNEYTYENGSGDWIEISASVKLGNIGFNF